MVTPSTEALIFRGIYTAALGLGDRITRALNPKRCEAGSPTTGTTEQGPFVAILGQRQKLINPPEYPVCVLPSSIESLSQSDEGAARCKICPRCLRKAWVTRGSSNPVTDSGWGRADAL